MRYYSRCTRAPQSVIVQHKCFPSYYQSVMFSIICINYPQTQACKMHIYPPVYTENMSLLFSLNTEATQDIHSCRNAGLALWNHGPHNILHVSQTFSLLPFFERFKMMHDYHNQPVYWLFLDEFYVKTLKTWLLWIMHTVEFSSL